MRFPMKCGKTYTKITSEQSVEAMKSIERTLRLLTIKILFSYVTDASVTPLVTYHESLSTSRPNQVMVKTSTDSTLVDLPRDPKKRCP